MRYIDPENERYQYMVRQTLNGFAVQVHIMPTNEWIALSKSVAGQLEISLPEDYCMAFDKDGESKARAELDRVAKLNNLSPIE